MLLQNQTQNKMIDLKDRSMSITRTFEAPVELVWKVLTTPEYISVWWGPEGFSNTIRTMDVQEGGIFDFTSMTAFFFFMVSFIS